VGVASAGAASPDGSGVDTVSLSDAAAAMIAAMTQFAANISVMKKADEMQKSAISLLG
jgi:flagellar basal body rod protein FlgC